MPIIKYDLPKKRVDRTPRQNDIYSSLGAGFNENRDCSVRAAAIACCVSYDRAHAVFQSCGRISGKGTHHYISEQAILELAGGPVLDERLHHDPMTLARFLRAHPTGYYILSTMRHMFAVIDGVVHDWGRHTSSSRSRIVRYWKVA